MRGNDICLASAPHVARGVDQTAPTPSFVYLQWACKPSRRSVRPVQSRRAGYLGLRCLTAAAGSIHLPMLPKAFGPVASRTLKNGFMPGSRPCTWPQHPTPQIMPDLEAAFAHCERQHARQSQCSTSEARAVQRSGTRTGRNCCKRSIAKHFCFSLAASSPARTTVAARGS